jgi:hypothetical protein
VVKLSLTLATYFIVWFFSKANVARAGKVVQDKG